MKSIFDLLKRNWPRVVALLLCATLIAWAVGCNPTVPSLTKPGVLVDRGELQLELEYLLATYELRGADLDQQEKLRKMILDNALLIAQAGTFNPFGLLTAIAAFYGAGSAAKDGGKLIKKKLTKNGST